jgi:hypothetical protein
MEEQGSYKSAHPRGAADCYRQDKHVPAATTKQQLPHQTAVHAVLAGRVQDWQTRGAASEYLYCCDSAAAAAAAAALQA